MSDADLLQARRAASTGDPEATERLRHLRCRVGECCAGHGPENPLRKCERFQFCAFRKWGDDSEFLVGFFAFTASQVRIAVVAHYACDLCDDAADDCPTCRGGSCPDWKHAYSEGWRVRKVEIVPVEARA